MGIPTDQLVAAHVTPELRDIVYQTARERGMSVGECAGRLLAQALGLDQDQYAMRAKPAGRPPVARKKRQRKSP